MARSRDAAEAEGSVPAHKKLKTSLEGTAVSQESLTESVTATNQSTPSTTVPASSATLHTSVLVAAFSNATTDMTSSATTAILDTPSMVTSLNNATTDMTNPTTTAASHSPSQVTSLSNAITDMTSAITTARDAVMGTPELLEAIISFLPARDILVKGQRVSRTWKDSISQSPMIQERVWLKAQASKTVRPNRYILSVPIAVPWPLGVCEQLQHEDLPVYFENVSINPLRQFGKVDDSVGWREIRRSPERTLLANPPLFHLSKFRLDYSPVNPFLYTVRPSWFGMHLTEPSITIAQVEIYLPRLPRVRLRISFGTGKKHLYSSAVVRDADGLTFETILAVAEKIRQSVPAGTYGADEALVGISFATQAGGDD